MPAGKRLPCQKEACAIQKCLQGTIAWRLENSYFYVYILCHVDKSVDYSPSCSEQNYQEDRCRLVIEAMRKCCKRESAINTKLCLGFKEIEPLNSTT